MFGSVRQQKVAPDQIDRGSQQSTRRISAEVGEVFKGWRVGRARSEELTTQVGPLTDAANAPPFAQTRKFIVNIKHKSLKLLNCYLFERV